MNDIFNAQKEDMNIKLEGNSLLLNWKDLTLATEDNLQKKTIRGEDIESEIKKQTVIQATISNLSMGLA